MLTQLPLESSVVQCLVFCHYLLFCDYSGWWCAIDDCILAGNRNNEKKLCVCLNYSQLISCTSITFPDRLTKKHCVTVDGFLCVTRSKKKRHSPRAWIIVKFFLFIQKLSKPNKLNSFSLISVKGDTETASPSRRTKTNHLISPLLLIRQDVYFALCGRDES
jgi:hypothetical protein